MFSMRLRHIIALISFAPLLSITSLANAAGPLAGCESEDPVLTVLELGANGLRLPKQYSADDDSDTQITGTILSNPIFGPEHVVFQRSIPAGLTLSFSEAPIVPLPLSAPLVDAIVTVVFTSDVTGGIGGDIIGRCLYDVRIVLPAELADLIQVPVRMCAVEGSPLAAGRGAGETISGTLYFSELQKATDFWLEAASIMFVPAFSPNGIPVIADPDTSIGNLGNLVDDRPEVGAARNACVDAWTERYPGQQGTILINTLNLIRSDGSQTAGALGVAWGRPSIFGNLRPRYEDMCTFPFNVETSDTTLGVVATVDKLAPHSQLTSPEARTHTFAHELGHTLFVSHGNGFDDNGDGLEPPTDGIRRYDQCDPLGGTTSPSGATCPLEDVLGLGCLTSLMSPTGAATEITPLQIETARGLAMVHPGARFDTQRDGEVFELLRDTQFAQITSGSCALQSCEQATLASTYLLISAMENSLTLVHSITGNIGETEETSYVAFVDLDNDPTTGCDSVGEFAIDFLGADLVSIVSVNLFAQETSLSQTWRCDGGTFVELGAGEFEVFTSLQSEAETGALAAGTVTMSLPLSLFSGSLGSAAVRMATIGEGLDNGGVQILPNAEGGGVTLSQLIFGSFEPGVAILSQPDAPSCIATPPLVAPGGATTIASSGLPPLTSVDVLMEGRLVGSGDVDEFGVAELSIDVPSTLAQGLIPVALVSRDGATANCGARVTGNRVTPATTLTSTPLHSAWNNVTVEVALSAAPYNDPEVPGGPLVLVESITYEADGGQVISSTTVLGTDVTVQFSDDGITNFSYHATAENGIVEPTQTAVIRIDTVNPTLVATVIPQSNAAGWHRTDVEVAFECSDALSGVFSCTATQILSSEGEGQSATGIAVDLALNEMELTVAGISIDKTPPVIEYSGENTYGLLDEVQVTCTTSDALSGVSETTCVNIDGPAYEFAAQDTFTATTTDVAGNVEQANVEVVIIPTFDDLCLLTTQFHNQGKTEPFCTFLSRAEDFYSRGKLTQARQMILNYGWLVSKNINRRFTNADALTLIRWSLLVP